MQQWEYLRWTVNGNKVERINGRVVDSKSQMLVDDALHQAGIDGWELVGFAVSPLSFYAFKRPKQ